MITAITLWVLIATASDGRAMLGQQFQSKTGCLTAKKFLESKRGTYAFVECIADPPPAGQAERRQQESPKSEDGQS